MAFVKSKSSTAVMRRCFGAGQHIGRPEVITEEPEWAGIVSVDGVLWNELREEVASCEPPLGVCLAGCEVLLRFGNVSCATLRVP